MDRHYLESRYAGFHQHLHLTLVSADEITTLRDGLLQNTHGLVCYKAALLHATEEPQFGTIISELRDLVAYQHKELKDKKLSLKKSHIKFLQSPHAAMLEKDIDEHHHDKAAVLEALRRSMDFFPKDTFSQMHADLHTQEDLSKPDMYTVLAAAHDAHHLAHILANLRKQHSILKDVYNVQNIETQRKVLHFMQHCFDDEITSLAMLDHQKLHKWSSANTFCQ